MTSSVGMIKFPIYGKSKKYIEIMCQTTNQKIVPSDVIAGYIGWVEAISNGTG